MCWCGNTKLIYCYHLSYSGSSNASWVVFRCNPLVSPACLAALLYNRRRKIFARFNVLYTFFVSRSVLFHHPLPTSRQNTDMEHSMLRSLDCLLTVGHVTQLGSAFSGSLPWQWVRVHPDPIHPTSSAMDHANSCSEDPCQAHHQ